MPWRSCTSKLQLAALLTPAKLPKTWLPLHKGPPLVSLRGWSHAQCLLCSCVRDRPVLLCLQSTFCASHPAWVMARWRQTASLPVLLSCTCCVVLVSSLSCSLAWTDAPIEVRGSCGLACMLKLSCCVWRLLIPSAQVGHSNPACSRTRVSAGARFKVSLAKSLRKMEHVLFCRRVGGLGGGGRAAGDQGPLEAHDPKGPMAHLLQSL